MAAKPANRCLNAGVLVHMFKELTLIFFFLPLEETRMSHPRFVAAAKASAIHFTISLAVAAIVALLIFQFWFPAPFGELAGGKHLFWIAVGVDVVCGPLLTAVLFSPSKTRRALTVDFSLIALTQLAALAYGVYSIALARPVILAFEVDRFVVVSHAQVDVEHLEQAQEQWRALSWNGPVLVGTREPKDSEEQEKSLNLSLQGQEPSQRPGWWQAYDNNHAQVKEKMKKLTELHSRLPADQQTAVDKVLGKLGRSSDELYYLPLTSATTENTWIVLLNEQGEIIDYAPADGFA